MEDYRLDITIAKGQSARITTIPLPPFTPELANIAMEMFGVDKLGLDWTDRLILETIIKQFHGGPVGIETVAAATGEDSKTIEEVYEPYLLQIGFINRTSRGRVVPKLAYEHLGFS